MNARQGLTYYQERKYCVNCNCKCSPTSSPDVWFHLSFHLIWNWFLSPTTIAVWCEWGKEFETLLPHRTKALKVPFIPKKTINMFFLHEKYLHERTTRPQHKGDLFFFRFYKIMTDGVNGNDQYFQYQYLYEYNLCDWLHPTGVAC